jgi:hypothetical protein
LPFPLCQQTLKTSPAGDPGKKKNHYSEGEFADKPALPDWKQSRPKEQEGQKRNTDFCNIGLSKLPEEKQGINFWSTGLDE